MNQATENFSDEAYVEGLLRHDESVLEAIYDGFQQPVMRSITTLGGSDATGKSFFRTALVEFAKQARAGTISAGAPFFPQLNALCLAHYRDWLAEREQPLPEMESAPEESEWKVIIPDSDALRETRATIDAWKKGAQTEDAGYPLWEKIRLVGQRHSETEKPRPKSNFNRNALIVFAVLIGFYLVYIFYFRAKTPAQVYDENFSIPESIISDLRSRYGPERGNDSVSARPSACEFYLREADHFYKAKDYASAQAALFGILDDSLATCHSDALYYIGIIALEQEEPELTLECFSKIEDLEHFGEDIYWYQALAFVKLAETNPLLRDKAARAVERARSNAQDSTRRAQAEKMLQHLSR